MPSVIYFQREELLAFRMNLSDLSQVYQYGDAAYKINMKYATRPGVDGSVGRTEMLLFVRSRGPQVGLIMAVLDSYRKTIGLFADDVVDVRNTTLPCFSVRIKRYPLPGAVDFHYRVKGGTVKVHPYRLSITTRPTSGHFKAFVGPVLPELEHLNRYHVSPGKKLYTLCTIGCSHRGRPPSAGAFMERDLRQWNVPSGKETIRKRKATWWPATGEEHLAKQPRVKMSVIEARKEGLILRSSSRAVDDNVEFWKGNASSLMMGIKRTVNLWFSGKHSDDSLLTELNT